ncbi:MAG: helix-turn-helix domain-containing protein [Pseudonocardiales bacterium]|nr:helix-turn-helix domain-containing protein [Pseudonocardiales bacterium]
MTAGPGLMPIGAFARLCRLTVKAVRHYDAEGLLPPAVVDPHSGYRYYRAEQVRTATTIALLRGLDVPLPVVRDVLAAPDPAAVAEVLAAQRERWAAELARREQVLRSLDVLLHRPERVRYDVVVAHRPAVRLAGVDGVVRAGAVPKTLSRACWKALVSCASVMPRIWAALLSCLLISGPPRRPEGDPDELSVEAVVPDCPDAAAVCEGVADVSCVVEPVPPALQPAITNPINIRATAISAGIYFSFSDISLSPFNKLLCLKYK